MVSDIPTGDGNVANLFLLCIPKDHNITPDRLPDFFLFSIHVKLLYLYKAAGESVEDSPVQGEQKCPGMEEDVGVQRRRLCWEFTLPEAGVLVRRLSQLTQLN